jgi:hypothetical protein
MSSKWMIATAVASACLACLVAAGAGAAGGPPSVAAGPAFGFVPSQNANQAGPARSKHLMLLQWYGGPVMHSTTVAPVFWGSRWSNSSFVGDKITGLDYFYSHVGGTAYSRTNGEYYDGDGNVNTTNISKGTDLTDFSATPSGAPSTSQVLAEVAKVTGNNPIAGAYYPVYSDQPRGSAGYCAWHSSGTINGKQVEFGFFFNLDGDPGCDPGASTTLGHSQGLSALANVTGHELSEMLTDPQLNAWLDQRGDENSDKCAWTFSGTVQIGAQNWKIQGNWSNAAANANSGYANGGCIQTA